MKKILVVVIAIIVLCIAASCTDRDPLPTGAGQYVDYST
jgi:uncharacterized protein YxeA